MPYRLTLLIVLLAVAACSSDEDRVVPPSTPSAPSAPAPSSAAPTAPLPDGGPGDARHVALAAALDTLQALVVTLEQVRDPVTAWNQAAEASRLLNALERDRAQYALNMTPEEARRRYPHEIARLEELEAQRDQELDRIMANPVLSHILIDEMNKAENAQREAGS